MPRSVSASGSTASAPTGSGAPDATRTTWPGASRSGSAAPAWTSCATGRCSGTAPPARSVSADAHGVAVAGGEGAGRQVDVGDDVGGEDAADRVVQRDVERRDRTDPRQDGRELVLDGLHPVESREVGARPAAR